MRSDTSRLSLAGSWILFWALRKITPSVPGCLPSSTRVWRYCTSRASPSSRWSDCPVQSRRNNWRPTERRLRLLIRHLQKQQERQLLDVVLVRQAVIPQDVAVVPQLANDGGGVAHAVAFLRRFGRSSLRRSCYFVQATDPAEFCLGVTSSHISDPSPSRSPAALAESATAQPAGRICDRWTTRVRCDTFDNTEAGSSFTSCEASLPDL